MVTDNNPDPIREHDPTAPVEHSHHGSGRVRRRVKIRKRIRIKKKPDAKKKIRKILEKLFWILVIVGFITSLIVMVVQLDIKDEKLKQQKRRAPYVR